MMLFRHLKRSGMPATASETGTPRLQSGQLVLVPFSTRHLTETYVGWLNDPTVVRYSEQRHRSHSLQSCASYFQQFTAAGNLFWAMENADALHIGNITASLDTRNRLADIGILIGDPNARGKGHGLAAWGAVLRFLQDHPGVDKVTGGCLATNTPMISIMDKSGMVPDGVRLRHYLWEGQKIDIIYRSLHCPKNDQTGSSGLGQ